MKIAIIGTTPHREKAPFADPSWEIWSQAQPNLPRWDRWFEIHDPTFIRATYVGLWQWMTEQGPGKPIYMREPHPEVPASVAYPRQQMLDLFGSWFFTSTVAWEMALAISLRPEEIALYGIDMADETEYVEQKPGCRFFIEKAMSLGIKVSVPAECDLLGGGKLYGLIDDTALETKIRAKKIDFDRRMLQLQTEHGELQRQEAEIGVRRRACEEQIACLTGAQFFLKDIENNWVK